MFKAAEHTQSYSVTDSPLKDSTYSHTDGDNDHAEVTEEKAASANSDFVGVYGNERCHQKWEAKIKVAGTVRTLGRFDTQEEAAREFDKHASLLGRPVNFPSNSNEQQAVKKQSRSKMEFVEEDGKLNEQVLAQAHLNEQLKEARKKGRQQERPLALSVSATKNASKSTSKLRKLVEVWGGFTFPLRY